MASRKNKKVVSLDNIADAEVLTKDTDSNSPGNNVNVSENKEAELKILLESVLKRHQENGSLAFELLKSAINQQADFLLKNNDYRPLVESVYTLADTFKQELDSRYTNDVKEVTKKFYGDTSDSSTEETKTLN